MGDFVLLLFFCIYQIFLNMYILLANQRKLPMRQFFASDGRSIRVSASASVLPMNIQDRLPLGWTGLLAVQRDFQVSSPTPQFKSIHSLKFNSDEKVNITFVKLLKASSMVGGQLRS